MKILVVLGSPRKKGNSETLSNTIVEVLEQQLKVTATDYLRLSQQTIAPCIGCGGCAKTGMCVITDDMHAIYEQIDSADIIFVASPIYFYGPSAQMKAFMDRCQARWSRKYLLKERFRQSDKRAGYLLSTGATQGKKLFDASILITRSFFDAIDVPYGGSFVVRGVDEKDALKENTEELEAARRFAEEIASEFSRAT